VPWEYVAVRRPDERDGRLYPVVTADAAGIEPDTGEELAQFPASSIRVHEDAADRVTRHHLHRFVHRSVLWVGMHRVAASCVAYNRPRFIVGGGGPFALITLVISAFTTISARRRRRGTLLVAQARFPWIAMVGYRKRVLRIGVRTLASGSPRLLLLDIGLRKGQDVGELAKQIVVAAARTQLAATPDSAVDVRNQLEHLAGDERAEVPADSKSFAVYAFPHPWPVHPETADPTALVWSD
jgi:hypothetical protein